MGARTCFVVWIEPEVDVGRLLRSSPISDVATARSLVGHLYPTAVIREVGSGTVRANLSPPDGMVYIGCYTGVTVIASQAIAADHPSETDPKFRPKERARVILHTMNSVVDWFAFAVWEHGALLRALSLSPDGGVVEDVGERFPFERPFWDGERPIEDYPLPFHPLDLGEEAMRALLGFVLEGEPAEADPDLSSITMTGFRISVTSGASRRSTH